jgi:hypothetical protein
MIFNAKDLNNQFSIFIGIDQTGAVARGSSATKPIAQSMPVAILAQFDGVWRLKLTSSKSAKPLLVHSFSKAEIVRCLAEADLKIGFASSSKTALIVDCVFGLAEEAWPRNESSLSALFTRAAAAPGGIGLQAAADFFALILKDSGHDQSKVPYPARRCEIMARANSVFRTRPYQKNIQCGTYRIWRDLGSAPEAWMQVRHFTPSHAVSREMPWVFEGYPSLIWRDYLQLRSRHLPSLASEIRRVASHIKIAKPDMQRMLSSPDAADAAVLAIGGKWLQNTGSLFSAGAPSKSKWLKREGWITGLPRRHT